MLTVSGPTTLEGGGTIRRFGVISGPGLLRDKRFRINGVWADTPVAVRIGDGFDAKKS